MKNLLYQTRPWSFVSYQRPRRRGILLTRCTILLVAFLAGAMALAASAAGPSQRTYLPFTSAGTDVYVTSPRSVQYKGGYLWQGSMRNLSAERAYTVTLSISTARQGALTVYQELPAIFPGQVSPYHASGGQSQSAITEFRIVSINDVPADTYAPLQIEQPVLRNCSNLGGYADLGFIDGMVRNTTDRTLQRIYVGHARGHATLLPGSVGPGEAVPFTLQIIESGYCAPVFAPPPTEPLEPFAAGLAAVGEIAP